MQTYIIVSLSPNKTPSIMGYHSSLKMAKLKLARCKRILPTFQFDIYQIVV